MNNVAPLRDQIVAKLYSAVLSDALDAAGHPRQAMRPFLRPLDDSLVLFGRVRTGLYANSYYVDLSKNPYAVEIGLVDDLQTGEGLSRELGSGRTRVEGRGSCSGRSRRPPILKRFASESAERTAGNEMALDVEHVLDCGMNGQEPLC